MNLLPEKPKEIVDSGTNLRDQQYKSFRIQFLECEKDGTAELRPHRETKYSFHNGPITHEKMFWCKKYNCLCKSGVCLKDRLGH